MTPTNNLIFWYCVSGADFRWPFEFAQGGLSVVEGGEPTVEHLERTAEPGVCERWEARRSE